MKLLSIILTRFILLLFIIVSVLLNHNVVQAETHAPNELHIILNSLLSQIKSLQTQIFNLQTNSSTVTNNIPPDTSEDCETFTQTLSIGSTDSSSVGQVSKLQEFLRSTGHYTYSQLTRYFGPITEKAVRDWQSSEGIVSGGSAATTGYGVVGPQTRSVLNSKCNQVIKVVPPTYQSKKTYSLFDIKSVTIISIDPIPNAIDDEYTLYTIVLKDQRIFNVKRSFAPLDVFEKAVADTGYTGDTAALLNFNQISPVVSAYSLSDVLSVTVTEVDSKDQAADGGYTLYVVTLKDTRVFNVKQYGMSTYSMFEKSLHDTGYTGNIDALVKMARN